MEHIISLLYDNVGSKCWQQNESLMISSKIYDEKIYASAEQQNIKDL